MVQPRRPVCDRVSHIDNCYVYPFREISFRLDRRDSCHDWKHFWSVVTELLYKAVTDPAIGPILGVNQASQAEYLTGYY